MALSAARSTSIMAGGRSPEVLSLPMADNVKVYQGSIVMIDAGYAKPGAAAASKKAAGIAMANVDNTISGHTAGGLSVPVKQCVAYMQNNGAGSDPVVAADVGASCYIEDDANVCHTSTGKTAAGTVVGLDSGGVWVAINLF
jgi:hypothetical protein